MDLVEATERIESTGESIAQVGDAPAMTEIFIQHGQFFRRLRGRPCMRAMPVSLSVAEVKAKNWQVVSDLAARPVSANDLRDAFERLRSRPDIRRQIDQDPDLLEHLVRELGLVWQ
jgi:hypothetical protein